MLYSTPKPTTPWEVSPEYTARRLLLIVMTLRATLLLSGLFYIGKESKDCVSSHYISYLPSGFSQIANDIMAFYAHSLAKTVGPTFRFPSIVYLASFWFDPAGESYNLRMS